MRTASEEWSLDRLLCFPFGRRQPSPETQNWEARLQTPLTGTTETDTDERLAERLIHFSRARIDKLVVVTGRGSRSLLKRLLDQGFRRVRRIRNGSHEVAERTSDILIVAGPSHPDAIGSLLKKNIKGLKDGGALILQLNELDDDCIVQSCLHSLGCSNANQFASSLLRAASKTARIVGALLSHGDVYRPPATA